jgi:catechol 2,3-dioxygenase-like lactoylglutathione lyase family enzyme
MRFLSICLPAICAFTSAFAQSTSPSTPGAVPAAIGMLNYVHAVTDLDKTIAFYHDVFGLEIGRAPSLFPNPGVPALVNAPGVSLRMGTVKMPGAKFVLELTQFSGFERKAGQPLHTDPGAANIQLRVRDINGVFAAIKKSGAPIITASGMPVKIGPANGNIRSLLVRDPDGFIIEVIQTPAAPDAPAGMVHGVGIGLTAANLDATRSFYHDMLGFELTPATSFSGDKAILDMVGAPAGAGSGRASTCTSGEQPGRDVETAAGYRYANRFGARRACPVLSHDPQHLRGGPEWHKS